MDDRMLRIIALEMASQIDHSKHNLNDLLARAQEIYKWLDGEIKQNLKQVG